MNLGRVGLHGAALCGLLLAVGAVQFQQQWDIEAPHLIVTSLALFALTGLALAKVSDPVPGWRSMIAWAALLRLAGVFGEPILEDDFYRYLWDGYRLIEAGMPYGVVPEQFFGDAQVPASMHAVLNGINYPELPTIYAPVQQALFGLSYLISPGRLWPLQAILAAADLGLLALLWHLGARRGAWLYALSPLVLKEIPFTAHPDGFGAALIVLALWARVQKRYLLVALACGLAAATKIFALPLIPFLLWRLAPGLWVVAGATAALAYAPFFWRATEMSTLAVFAQHWQFNPALFAVAKDVLGEVMDPRVLCGLLYAVFWCTLLRHFHALTAQGWRLPRGDLIVGGLLLVSPVINAWYLLWLLPFAALHFSVTAWAASVLLLLSYLHPPGVYDLPRWLPWVEFLPLSITLAWDLAARRSFCRSNGPGALDCRT